ncbi:MAG: helix-turn-helix transcriptional regulator, partial [Bacteroidota bacterium]|nr:helix-turn-helix transcriptional regulator [Bacteroidota bacterium]
MDFDIVKEQNNPARLRLSHNCYMKLRNIIGDNIRCMRNERVWTQEAFGMKCGIGRDYIGRIERGEVNVGIDHLEKIGTTLNIEPYHLLKEGH